MGGGADVSWQATKNPLARPRWPRRAVDGATAVWAWYLAGRHSCTEGLYPDLHQDRRGARQARAGRQLQGQ